MCSLTNYEAMPLKSLVYCVPILRFTHYIAEEFNALKSFILEKFTVKWYNIHPWAYDSTLDL